VLLHVPSDITRFAFQGASEYLGDIVARTDAPLLDVITLTHRLVVEIPHLSVGRSRGQLKRADVLYTFPGMPLYTKSSWKDLLVANLVLRGSFHGTDMQPSFASPLSCRAIQPRLEF
jgi:hypothetical protein